MTTYNQEELLKLLKATRDILTKCDQSHYVLDVMSTTAIWDNAECDGGCLLSEINDILGETND